MRSRIFKSINKQTYVLLLLMTLSGCSISEAEIARSDEKAIRQSFQIPKSVELISFNSRPKTGGWPREGLKIDATFAFSPKEFSIYQETINAQGLWVPLPISEEFLLKITNIPRQFKSYQKRLKDKGQPIPEAGSVYSPSQEELLNRWKAKLPLDVKHGFYHCLTAGDNLMRTADKRPCSQRNSPFNDFMLGVLDTDNQRLTIKVHTSY